MSRRCVFVSDLHHFSRRAEQRRYEEAIRRSMKDADVLVLGGDIFDFKWSTLASHKATIDAAGRWVRDLTDFNPNCQVHYILGNHDFDEQLMDQLELISNDQQNFDWHPYHVQLGNSLFLHGDVADRAIDHDQLVLKRQAWKSHRRPHALRHNLYDFAMNLRLHRIPAFVVHPHRQVAKRLVYYLDRHPELQLETISRVYFGHTHVAIDGYQYQGIHFFNGGAPMKGLQFRLVEADIS